MEIGPLVLEKIFEGVLPYIDSVGILETFVPPRHGGRAKEFGFGWLSDLGGEDL